MPYAPYMAKTGCKIRTLGMAARMAKAVKQKRNASIRIILEAKAPEPHGAWRTPTPEKERLKKLKGQKRRLK